MTGRKIVHRAAKVRADGAVSALCYSTPKAIDLSTATWTLIDAQTTCKKCKAIIGGRCK